MYGKLLKYTRFIERESDYPTPELIAYHDEMVRNFQHERLIHLMVTLFFAIMMILFAFVSIVIFLEVPANLSTDEFLLLGAAILVDLILLVTTLMYIRHYYRLENGIEYLYKFTAKLRGHKI